MRDQVTLSAEHFVAEGTDRKCFRHPQEPDLCIKVLHPERRAGRFWREINYFTALQRRGVEFTHVAAFHGLIDTNLGRGAVFDLVRDDDGQVARSLEYYLQQQDQQHHQWISVELEALKQDLWRQWIAVHDLNPSNLLAKRLGFDRYRLVAIDGVGHNHWIPLANYSRRFARRKLARVWNRRYRQWYAPYPALLAQLKSFPRD